jgi:excinuclease Cho
VLVKSRMPAYNRALRRKTEAGIARLENGLLQFIAAPGVEPFDLSDAYGPFASRAAFRATLRELAAGHRLCWRRLQLERRPDGPCFATTMHFLRRR